MLSWSIFSDLSAIHSWNACRSLESQKNSLNPFSFWVHGCSGSSVLVPPESLSAVLVMMSTKSVSTCNRSHARRVIAVNDDFKGEGYPCSMLSFDAKLLTQRHEIRSPEFRDSTLSYSKNPEFLSYLSLNRYQVVTDRRTDRRTDRLTIASTRLALPAVARKNKPFWRRFVLSKYFQFQ